MMAAVETVSHAFHGPAESVALAFAAAEHTCPGLCESFLTAFRELGVHVVAMTVG